MKLARKNNAHAAWFKCDMRCFYKQGFIREGGRREAQILSCSIYFFPIHARLHAQLEPTATESNCAMKGGWGTTPPPPRSLDRGRELAFMSVWYLRWRSSKKGREALKRSARLTVIRYQEHLQRLSQTFIFVSLENVLWYWVVLNIWPYLIHW